MKPLRRSTRLRFRSHAWAAGFLLSVATLAVLVVRYGDTDLPGWAVAPLCLALAAFVPSGAFWGETARRARYERARETEA